MFKNILLLVLFVFSPLSLEAVSCKIFLGEYATKSTLLTGSSTVINLATLSRSEEIEPEVRKVFDESVKRLDRQTLEEGRILVIDYVNSGSEFSKARLVENLEPLVFIAIRPILHHFKNADVLEDYLQVARLTLWEHVSKNFSKIKLSKLSVFYWDGIRQNLRATIFVQLRKQLILDKKYQFTSGSRYVPEDIFEYAQRITKMPKSILTINPQEGFTFQETVFLFARNEEDLAAIAKKYELSLEEVQAEYALQQALFSEDFLDESEASTYAGGAVDEASAVENVIDQDLEEIVKQALLKLRPREERIIRMRFFEELTLAEVGAAFNLSKDRVRQIEGRALRKLMHPAYSRELRNFVNIYNSSVAPREYYDPAYRKAKKLEIQERLREEAEENKARRLRQEEHDDFLASVEGIKETEIENRSLLVETVVEKLQLAGNLLNFLSLMHMDSLITVHPQFAFFIERINKVETDYREAVISDLNAKGLLFSEVKVRSLKTDFFEDDGKVKLASLRDEGVKELEGLVKEHNKALDERITAYEQAFGTLGTVVEVSIDQVISRLNWKKELSQGLTPRERSVRKHYKRHGRFGWGTEPL